MGQVPRCPRSAGHPRQICSFQRNASPATRRKTRWRVIQGDAAGAEQLLWFQVETETAETELLAEKTAMASANAELQVAQLATEMAELQARTSVAEEALASSHQLLHALHMQSTPPPTTPKSPHSSHSSPGVRRPSPTNDFAALLQLSNTLQQQAADHHHDDERHRANHRREDDQRCEDQCREDEQHEQQRRKGEQRRADQRRKERHEDDQRREDRRHKAAEQEARPPVPPRQPTLETCHRTQASSPINRLHRSRSSRAKTNKLSNRGPSGFRLRLKSWETLTITCASAA